MKKITLLFIVFWASLVVGQTPLLIPDTLSGTQFSLVLQTGAHQFFSGQNTNTMGVNGPVLGPTLFFNKGDSVHIEVENRLGDTTTVHWHGLHVSSENDGGPHTFILPGDTWQPQFEVLDKASTYWYHPHLHKKTDLHVSMGIAGLIIVRDSAEAALALPRTYGTDDFPLVIQTKDFDQQNQIKVHSNSDDIVMVNATVDAELNVPAQVVRLRVLNGSSQRVLNLGLSGNRTFYQIASDGGLLSQPIALTRLMLSPGERAELLIDFSGLNGQTVMLNSYASALPSGIYGAANPGMAPVMNLTGYNPNSLNGNDFKIMQFVVGASLPNGLMNVPTNLVPVSPIPAAAASTTRNLILSPARMGPNQLNGNFLINNRSFDMGVIDYRIPLGATEIWSIRNQSGIAHPFHIHDVQFFILDRNGAAPSAHEQGLKDVILIRPMETVRFITRFDDFANDSVPYMFHCHMLLHEDGGMMGQFVVEDKTTVLDPKSSPSPFVVFPNPSEKYFQVQSNSTLDIWSIELLDMRGKQVIPKRIYQDGNRIQVGNTTPGLYIVRLEPSRGVWVHKLCIQ